MENLNKSHLRKYLIFYVKGANNRLQVLVNFKNVKCLPNISLENKCKTGELTAAPPSIYEKGTTIISKTPCNNTNNFVILN